MYRSLRPILTVVAVVAVFLAPVVPAQADPSPPDLAPRIDQWVQAQRAHTGLPGAVVAVTRGREVVRVAGYGHDGADAPLTPSSPVPIASLSKSMTALAATRLAADDRLDLDRPVVDLVPEFRLGDPAAARITTRALLTQTSGMADSSFPDFQEPDATSTTSAVTRLAEAPLADPPGTRFHYHNPNFQVAARVLEVAAGRPFPDVLRQTVFAPSGMAASDTVATTDDAGVHGTVRLYGTHVPSREPSSWVQGSHGVVTTAEDLARWLMVQSADDATVAATHVPALRPDGYALGWQAEDRGGGDRRLSHSGQWSTWTANQILLPDEGYGIAVVTPTGVGLEDDAPALAEGIVEVVRGGDPAPHRTAATIGDAVAGVLTVLVLGLGVLAWRRAPTRWPGRRPWRLLPGLLPVALPFLLPDALGTLFGGRAVDVVTLVYAFPAFVVLTVTAAAVAVGVTVRRARQLWLTADSTST